MSFAARHAKGSKFNVNTEGYSYAKLSELELGKTYIIQALYINTKGKYDPYPVAPITDGLLVNLPAYLTDEVKEMINDPDDVADINAGKAGFVVEEYEQNGKMLRGINWVDILPQ